MCDSVDSKPFLENLVRNNSECTGFFNVLFNFFSVCNSKERLKEQYSRMKPEFTQLCV